MFPLSRWLGVTGVGRLPMASALDDPAWVRSLDGRWRVLVTPRVDDVTATLIDGPTDGWDEVDVPGTWVLQLDGHGAPIYLNVRMPFGGQPPDVPEDNPTAVYRRQFTVPATWRRRRTHLRIGSADSMGFVWVNGAFVGLGTDSKLASTYDVSNHLRAGRNDLCIVVPRWSAATWIEDQDQWWLPGLHRSVELVSLPPTHLADAAMVPGLDGTTGTLDLDLRVESPDERPLTVEVAVGTIRGRRLATTGRLDVPRWAPGDAAEEMVLGYIWRGSHVEHHLRVPGVEAWNHEAPTRYRATATLRDAAGAVLDVRTRLVGFRSVEVADGQLLINGQPVVINGVNRHESHPDRGRTVTAADTRRDLELMKRHHVNAVRTAHYPNAESFYDLCDELGLYVVDEGNVEAHARWGSLADDPAYAGAMLERAQRMVLRDRAHPCVIAWSLGNESGYGAAHDAMAAWIRRVDPTRPLHYEGGVAFDLDAANPVSDLVCPMYAPVERIVRWSRDGADTRRPLILCEYGHAMGQAGGLDDYWAVFGVERRLQGGFVWEWADHALRRHDGEASWLAFGGDFGEADHDGRFVCDGLVSADREPHPLLEELAALACPIAVERNGDGRLVVHNRRWFRDLGDVAATVGRARLELPTIPPQGSAPVPDPAPGTTLDITLRAAGWTATVQLPASDRPPPPTWRRVARCGVDADGVTLGDLALGWPVLCLWRPPTDNDDPPGAWRPAPGPAIAWRDLGLDRLRPTDIDVRTGAGQTTRSTRYEAATGAPIEHRQTARLLAGEILLTDDVRIDRSLHDLPRVGIAFTLPPGFERLTWSGLGPGSSYPDRRAAVRSGVWRSTVSEQTLPFVVPQEHGLHLDTDWLDLDGLVVTADRRFAFSALHHSAGDLATATHAHLVPTRPETFVHLDLAHRGLGTFACGPDTEERHRVNGGRHRMAWHLRRRPSRSG